jgi:DNA-binding winged helix-turn-helix (wHTH) protein
MQETPSHRVARFGLFELDLTTRELRRRGVKIPLQEQPFQVLARLVARPGDLVTREELRAALWPGAVFVDFDHGLNKAVAKIRRAIGDLANSPRFIETLERRGYRFIAPVDLTGRPAPPGPPAGRQASPRLVHLMWDDRAIPLPAGTHVIGRDPESAVFIDSTVVSRRHAILVVDDRGATIEDLGSRNGTMVNGERLESRRSLSHGDRIGVGAASLVLYDPPAPTAAETESLA